MSFTASGQPDPMPAPPAPYVILRTAEAYACHPQAVNTAVGILCCSVLGKSEE